MKNLAGIPEADQYILEELQRARIPYFNVETGNTEVPYTIIGRLGKFEFRRAWTYWVVQGPLPIYLAERIYADPVGKTDIRVNGDAGCSPPESWAKWLTPDGKEVLPVEEEAEFDRHETLKARKGAYLFSGDPASLGAKQLVTSYHIDTEVGLRIFADTIREMTFSLGLLIASLGMIPCLASYRESWWQLPDGSRCDFTPLDDRHEKYRLTNKRPGEKIVILFDRGNVESIEFEQNGTLYTATGFMGEEAATVSEGFPVAELAAWKDAVFHKLNS